MFLKDDNIVIKFKYLGVEFRTSFFRDKLHKDLWLRKESIQLRLRYNGWWGNFGMTFEKLNWFLVLYLRKKIIQKKIRLTVVLIYLSQVTDIVASSAHQIMIQLELV